MVVHPEQVEMLRAYLVGDPREAQRLNKQIMADKDRHQAFPFLLYVAFQEALSQRFSSGFTLREIVRFVADVRIDQDVSLNPYAAEVLIRRALGDEHSAEAEVSDVERTAVQMTVLDHLVAVGHLDESSVDAMLTKAKGRL